MTPVHQERRRRLMAAMSEAGCDAVLVYGNAWQCDYLRYVTDFPPVEGEALALFFPMAKPGSLSNPPPMPRGRGLKCPMPMSSNAKTFPNPSVTNSGVSAIARWRLRRPH